MKCVVLASMIAAVSLNVAAQDNTAQQPTGLDIRPEDARSFIDELDASVHRAMLGWKEATLDSAAIDAHQNHLENLQRASQRFGTVFTPFHSCQEAAIYALTSWKGMVAGDDQQFHYGFAYYLRASAECREQGESDTQIQARRAEPLTTDSAPEHWQHTHGGHHQRLWM